MQTQHAAAFFSALVATPHMQAMWNLRNGGVPVFVHTIDVALLALDSFDDWQDRHGALRLVPMLVGALTHDLTKVTARYTRGQPGHLSHSTIMLIDPLAAVVEAKAALAVVADETGVALDDDELEMTSHIIMSHHGPWGSVAPRCPEAALVHACDLHSARFYRQPPIDANDILQLMDDGLSRAAAARMLGVSPQIVTRRLSEACQAEWIDSPDDLLTIWRRRGYVVAGSEEAIACRQHIRLRAEQATLAPAPLLEHPTYVAWTAHGD